MIEKDIPKVSMIENIYNKNKKYLGSTALIYQGKEISYDEFFRNICIVCESFKKRGVKKGDIVTVLPVNTPEFIYAYYALNMLGAIVNAIHPLSSKKEIVGYLNEVDSKMIICSDANCHMLNSALKDNEIINKKVQAVIAPITNSTPLEYKLKSLSDKSAIEKSKKLKENKNKVLSASSCFMEWKDFVKTGLKEYRQNKNYQMKFNGRFEDTAVIVHTGGTTGVPKGAMISNKNGVALVESHIMGEVNYNRSQVGLANISIYTAFGFFDNINVPLSLGIGIVLEPVYSPESFIDDIKKYKPNILLTVPSFLEEFVEKEEKQNNDYSHLDVIIVGGQKMANASLDRVNSFLTNHQPMKYRKTKVDVGYGLSETVGAATSTLFEGCSKKYNLGRAFPFVNIKIVDLETKKEVSQGEIGEICISGPTVMQGYYNMPSENNKVFDKDENGILWYHTGDFGSIDEKSELNVYGRIRKMITMYNGYKIATQNLEETIESLEEVKSCVIVGMKDPNHPQGKVPKAYVSLNDGVTEDVKNKIINFVQQNMNERNKIYDIQIVQQIPLTKMGKKDFNYIEILELFNSLYSNVRCDLSVSKDGLCDYECNISFISDNSNPFVGEIEELINILNFKFYEKSINEGVVEKNIKSIKYDIVSDINFVDSNKVDKNNCKEPTKKLI